MTAVSSAPRAVLFDLDGTLVDTNHLHTVAWWEAFRQQGCAATMAGIHRALGMGGDRIPGYVLGREREPELDGRISDAHKVLYGQYSPVLAPQPGAVDLVRAVAARGVRVVLATSADERELAAMRRSLDVEDAIGAATTGDDVAVTKPAPDAVLQAVTRSGVEPEEVLFVGDSVWDMQACVAAGVPGVGLLCGGICAHDLQEAGAGALYRDPADLLSHLDEHIPPAGRSPLVS